MTIQHAPAFMAGIAAMPYTRRPGQIVIQCFARLRTGTKAINDLTDALVAYFNYWSSGDLECIEASQLVVGEFEGFYQINVNIRFRAGRPRNTHPTRVERVFYAHTKVENMSSGAKVNSYLIAEVTPGVTPPVRSTPFD